MDYLTEYEDDDGKTQVKDHGRDLAAARAYARKMSRKGELVYIVGCTETERIGQEVYAQGRRDSVDGERFPAMSAIQQ